MIITEFDTYGATIRTLHDFIGSYHELIGVIREEFMLPIMSQFVDAIANNKPVPVNREDGREPVVIGLAAWKSYNENRPVRLSEI